WRRRRRSRASSPTAGTSASITRTWPFTRSTSRGSKTMSNAKRQLPTPKVALALAAAVFAFGFAARADAPRAYAIKGARIVTVAGAPIQSGTIVLRNGLIEAVGADAAAPADAVAIDGAGLTVSPGLIDLGNSDGT